MQLDAFPKHELRLHAHVLQADGGELAAMIVAASLVLADAGVPLNDLVPACTVAQPPLPLRSAPSSSPPPRAAASSSAAARQPSVLDPCASELRAAAGVLTLALAPSTREAAQWRQSGCFDEERRRARRGVTRASPPSPPRRHRRRRPRPRRLPPRPPHRSGSRPSPPTGCLSTRRRGGSDGGTRERVASMARWRASLRASLRAHVTRSFVTRARVIPNPRFPLVIPPIAPPPRAHAAEVAVAAAAAAALRARVASMTRRDAARHRVLLRTPVRRPRASLVRVIPNPRLPLVVPPPSSPPPSPTRARGGGGGGGGATAAACARASPR